MEISPEKFEEFIDGLIVIREKLATVDDLDKEIFQMQLFDQYLSEFNLNLEQFRELMTDFLCIAEEESQSRREEIVKIMFDLFPKKEIKQIIVKFLKRILEINTQNKLKESL